MTSIAIPLDLGPLRARSPHFPDDTGSDEAIAAALRAGDQSAVESLWREYGRTVFAYLVRTVGDRGEAEDVHQQVFVEAWQRRLEFDAGRGSLLGWLMTIARSRAIDSLRKRRPEPADPAAVDSSAPGSDDPEDELLERWRVAHMLRRIPAAEAELLELRFYEELSQREIAARVDMPLGTVKMRMVQALERLRELIEDEEGGR